MTVSRRYLRFWLNVRGIVLFVFLLIVPVIIAYLITMIIGQTLKEMFPNLTEIDGILLLIQIITQFILFIGLFFLIRKRAPVMTAFISSEHWFYSLGRALFVAISAFGIAFIATLLFIELIEFLPIQLSSEIMQWISAPNKGFTEIFREIEANRNVSVLIWIAYIVVCGPVMEEILFRGFLQESISRLIRVKHLDIVVSALLFGLFHYNSLANILFAFIVGIFLAHQRKKTGSINTGIWAHAIINFSGMLCGLIVYSFSKSVL